MISKLMPKLVDATKPRRIFNASTQFAADGNPSSSNRLLIVWGTNTNPDTQFTVHIGQSSQADDLMPGVHSTVTQIGPGVYRYVGGAVAVRTHKTRFVSAKSMLCVNRDTVDLTYPVP